MTAPRRPAAPSAAGSPLAATPDRPARRDSAETARAPRPVTCAAYQAAEFMKVCHRRLRLAEHLVDLITDGDVIVQRAGDERMMRIAVAAWAGSRLSSSSRKCDFSGPARRQTRAARASSAVDAAALRSFNARNQRSMVIAGERGECRVTLHHAHTSARPPVERGRAKRSSARSAPARAAPITTHAPRKTRSSTQPRNQKLGWRTRGGAAAKPDAEAPSGA